ncbi:MAG: MGMT family protein [Candidatus Omnitrophica bacterium]|nr:MGMT family protein [Candidatus Omnitrophota bacterium]
MNGFLTRDTRRRRIMRQLPPPRTVSRVAWGSLTPFQQQVYRAICRIPKGETRSYQWVARQIGRPRAMRAVGNALNQNPFAPCIPCHRVVRSDGTLGGYARGLARKRALLYAEGWKEH